MQPHQDSAFCRRVRELRAARGWSLDALAQASGVSRSMLSQIEREQANPTLAVAMRIARAFSMTLGDLVESPESSPTIEVIRAADTSHHFQSGDGVRLRTLSPLSLEKDLEFYELQLDPGATLRSAPHFAGTREFLNVERGKLEIQSGRESALLSKGDSAAYPADVRHIIRNPAKSTATAFLVVVYR